MGSALFMIFCAVGTCLFVLVTVFVGIGAAMFGPYLSFACVGSGALAGAAISYFIAHRLGREFIYSLIGGRLRNFDDLIERNGFKAVLFLRLMFTPFAPVNYGAGLANIRFRDYFFATALGEVPTIFVTIFFIGEIRDIWILGDWGLLFSVRVALSLGFLTALVLIAKLVKKKFSNRPVLSLED